jgi:hypothetical protein
MTDDDNEQRRRDRRIGEAAAEAMKQAFRLAAEQLARKEGLTLKEFILRMRQDARERRRREQWGTMPDQYDPASDSTHPVNGWKPDEGRSDETQ